MGTSRIPDIVSTSPTFGRLVPEPLELLEEHSLSVAFVDPSDRPALIAALASARAWIVGVDRVTAALLDEAPHLELLCKHGVGTDNIDTEAAAERGIEVVSLPSLNSEAVADLSFGLMLGIARMIPSADAAIRGGSWRPSAGPELWRKTLGIIGFGNVGRAVARRARGFEMRILVFDPFHQGPPIERVISTDLHRLLQESDFVSIHAPLTDETRSMIGRRELATMRSSAYLVNCGRGGVIDEDALIEALADRSIAGAALDVLAEEPPSRTNPILDAERLVLSPHSGGYSLEALAATGHGCAEQIVRKLCPVPGPGETRR